MTSSCCCLMESRKISRRRNQEITKEEPDRIPVRTVHHHPEEEEGEAVDPDANITWDDEPEEPAVFSAKHFYASLQRKKARPSCSTDQRPRGFDNKGFERRSFRFNRQPFVPPLPGSRSFRGLEWEPSLSSVQELSQEI
ncbi:hypothetical protein LINGRAHAP2_LOCUS37027 [Linum grandiflorum]